MNEEGGPKAALTTLARSTTTVNDVALIEILRHALTPDTARLIASLVGAS